MSIGESIVTTPRKREDLEPVALETSRRTGVPFVKREDRALETLRAETGAAAICVEATEGPFIGTAQGKLFFHEGTSVLRTGPALGEPPSLVRSLGLEPDDRLLDATLGMATDALVAATYLRGGTVTGVESHPLVADIVARGLSGYDFTRKRIAEAAAKINVVRADYRTFLESLDENEYDIVYFDPMFEMTVDASPKMRRLREIVDMAPLTPEDVELAARVARKRVVVKARRGCFGAIEFTRVAPSGKSIIYGIIEV